VKGEQSSSLHLIFSREGDMTDYMTVDDGGGRSRKVPVEYPGNSKTGRSQVPPKTKPEKVTIGEVVLRKPGLGKRIRNSFARDEEQGIPEMIIMDIMVPLAKNMVADSFSAILDGLNQGIQRAIFGDTLTRSGSGRPGTFYTSYNRVQRQVRGVPPAPAYGTIGQRGRSRHDFKEVILGSRGEAEEILDGLKEQIDLYGVATVEDFYSLAGITGDFAGNKWGWTDLSYAGVRLVRGGYIVDLPRTSPID
jgi:hypothetical protein